MRARISTVIVALFLSALSPLQPSAHAAVATGVGVAQSNLLMAYDLANPAGLSGTTLTDLSGNGYNGTLIQTSSKPSLAAGNGYKLDFTGNGGYVDLPDIVSASNWSGLSVSFYANMGTRTVVERIFDFGMGQANNNIWVGMGDGNNMAIEVWRDASALGWCRSASNSVVANEWAHWTVVLDGVTCKWYKNNVLSLSTNYTYLPWAKTLTLNYLGKSNWNDPAFEGGIGDFALYKSALTDAERLQNYNAQTDLTSPTLSTVNLSMAENKVNVDTLTASEPSTFSITSGGESSEINMTTSGVITFRAAPNFEVPTDADRNNVYLLSILVIDANGNSSSGTIYITVTNVAEVATMTFNSLSANPYKGIPVIISVTPTAGGTAGKVSYLVNGKRIPRCYRMNFTGTGVSSCSWKPSIRGTQELTITFTPNGSEYSATSLKKSFFVNNRATNR